MRRIADEQGFSYELREMGLAEMLDAVAKRDVDAAAAALTTTADHKQRVDFTHPVFTSGLGVAIPQRLAHTWFLALKRVASGAFIHSLREELNRQILRIITEAEWAPMLDGYLGRER